jgi:hypothetical protein
MQRARNPEGSTPRRLRIVAAGLVVAALLGLMAFLRISQQTNSDPRSSATPAPSETLGAAMATTTAPAATVGVKEEVVSRLREILRIRDRAIQARDRSLLADIYTVDCPCLKGDQRLIRKLREERLLWRGIEVVPSVQSAERVNDRLWIVSALITTNSFEIVNESGAVVRRVSKGREKSRFALARPIGEEEWLLGYAAVTQERD